MPSRQLARSHVAFYLSRHLINVMPRLPSESPGAFPLLPGARQRCGALRRMKPDIASFAGLIRPSRVDGTRRAEPPKAIPPHVRDGKACGGICCTGSALQSGRGWRGWPAPCPKGSEMRWAPPAWPSQQKRRGLRARAVILSVRQPCPAARATAGRSIRTCRNSLLSAHRTGWRRCASRRRIRSVRCLSLPARCRLPVQSGKWCSPDRLP